MSSSPMRVTSGFTQDTIFQPLGQIGQPNPLFYATYHDDFIGYLPGRYTETVNANGTIAQTAGAFGRLLFTTNSSTPLTTDIASAQVDAAAFTLAVGYKCAYLARLQLASVTNAAFAVGLMQTTTTPFTVTDGIYFYKPTGSTTISLNVVSGSITTGSVTIPVSALTLANATDFDLGFLYDGKGNVLVYAGNGLVGQVNNQNTAALGPMARVTPTSFTTAVLSPTLAVQSGAAAATTMNVDFQYCARER